MEERHLKGLMHSVASRIGTRPAPEAAIDRLQRLESPDGLGELLGTLDLPYSPAVFSALERYLAEDWAQRKATLVRAAEVSRTERMDPSS